MIGSDSDQYNQHHLELKASSQKHGKVANVRSSRQGAKKLQNFINLEFLSKLKIYEIFEYL